MTDQPSLFAREDTLLGVCEGLGDELGVPANILRVAFALGLFWNPIAVIAAYLTLGVVLAAFRWLVPARRPARPAAPAPRRAVASNDADVTFAEAA